MLVDRVGKQRQVRLSGWDWAHLAFVAGYGCALIYAELYMVRDTGLMNYVGWMNVTLNGYIYFLTVREGLSRRGFRPEILVRWLLATLSVACLLALAQARDFAGMRGMIDGFYHQALLEQHMEGPSEAWQARAPTAHANSLAMLLLCGLPLLIGLADMRKLRWFDWIAGGLIIVTSIMTYSRIGILCLAAIGLALIVAWSYRKEYHRAAAATFGLIAFVVAFTAIVMIFDISRFKVLMEHESPVAGLSTQTAGWRAREMSLKSSVARAEEYPLTGLKAASSANNQEDLYVKSQFTYSGLLLNVYVYSFVSYGLIGVAFILALLWLSMSQIRFARGNRAFATAAFVLGVALLTFGIAENVVFYDGAMYTVNIVMAFCAMTVKASQPAASLPSARALAA